jgi:hypothetical protein
VDWVLFAFIVAFVSFLLWAFVGSYVAATIRDGWPDLYVKAGSPKPSAFWLGRAGPGAFDGFTLLRRFRKANVQDRDVLIQLELACWLRWIQIVAAAGFFVAVFTTLGHRFAP